MLQLLLLDYIAVLRRWLPPSVNDRVAWSVGLSVGLSPSEPCKKSEAIEIPFAFKTRVGPRKDLLYIADRFGRILYCVE